MRKPFLRLPALMPQIIQRQKNMKKTYLAPEMEVCFVQTRARVLTASQDRNLTTGASLDEDDFVDD